MTITELKEQLISFTAEYKIALERQTRAVLEYEKLETELKKLQNELSLTKEMEESDSGESEDENSEIIDLEAKLEKLKLELLHAESEVELEARQTHARATESHIKALVGTDANVHRLRTRIIDGKAYIKTKKADLNRERKEIWEKQKQKRAQTKLQPESEELTALQEKLALAERESLSANDEVEVLKTKLETLKLLASLMKTE
jgi:chromosome segregation ATPase